MLQRPCWILDSEPTSWITSQISRTQPLFGLSERLDREQAKYAVVPEMKHG